MLISKLIEKNMEKLLTKKLQAKRWGKVKFEAAFFPNYLLQRIQYQLKTRYIFDMQKRRNSFLRSLCTTKSELLGR